MTHENLRPYTEPKQRSSMQKNILAMLIDRFAPNLVTGLAQELREKSAEDLEFVARLKPESPAEEK